MEREWPDPRSPKSTLSGANVLLKSVGLDP